MLELFEQYGTHVTWATVGMLFHEDKKSLLAFTPDERPGYHLKKLSAYEYIATVGIGGNEGDDPFHYAASLIKKISQTPYQELGSHTFGHYYCNEAGQTVDQFRADLKAAQHTAALYGKTLTSLVFPRNQFNDTYLKVCWEEGITSVRSNPSDWFWNIESAINESLWKRLNRGMDAFFPIGKKTSYTMESLKRTREFPLCIPASRLLRRFHPKEYFMNDLKIKRIQSEMTYAAQHGEVYHLWWHPHNFGHFPEESLQGLIRILDHYAYCQKQFGMHSLNMGEITEAVIGSAAVYEKKSNTG